MVDQAVFVIETSVGLYGFEMKQENKEQENYMIYFSNVDCEAFRARVAIQLGEIA